MLFRFFPLFFVLLSGFFIVKFFTDNHILANYLGAFAMLTFLITFMIPAQTSDFKNDWKNHRGRTIYIIIVSIILPIAVMLWGILSGTIEKL